MGNSDLFSNTTPYTDADGKLRPEIEALLRYTISQWASIKEQMEPTHPEIITDWLQNALPEWIKHNTPKE